MSFANLELARHIQDEVNFILQYTHGKTKEDVLNNPVLSRAIIRSLEIIGEASKKWTMLSKLAIPKLNGER